MGTYVCVCTDELITTDLKMAKYAFYNISRKYKTYPANINMECKSQLLDEHENVTLIVNRRSAARQSPKRWTTFRCRWQKKLAISLALIFIGLLIIFTYTDLLFRNKIFSVFLSSRFNQITNVAKLQTSYPQSEQPQGLGGDASNSNNPIVKPMQYLLNYSSMHLNKTSSSDYNIFVIYTRENYRLQMKFDLFAHSLFKHTNAQLHLHIITDKESEMSVLDILQRKIRKFRRIVIYTMYDVQICSNIIQDITAKLSPYFSSMPNSYYSDSLFFLSLGLHRIADKSISRAILFDCDIVFRSDVRLLFAEFDRFLPHQLFGLAPELTPVYRHILYRYRVRFPKSNFGNPYHPMQLVKNNKNSKLITNHNNHERHGYPGLNSGVVLMLLNRIRDSKTYLEVLTQYEVHRLVSKYSFKGHLGDQDFFTLLGYEYPNLIYRLDCIWNRQLCTWWKDHGYSNIFDAYFRCEGVIKMYHGNCNTRIPE
ncbi:xyloside xylosyltransferase 1 isoform X1 [Drosophila nasuta]|uniref:Xyloside xylosyltransferase 1 isoform X1 n=2 Tax=Drosophila albomicans TaxID=7291 RepID=A0A6P8X9Y3_DROAB|nr:xyloside xylosyltransferase 1 isoform X1 [Drosophila albomicans]XP_060659687.1 xyloside xylosyltransferase 1 isoform X1 [Drosophila nasuta]